jgi:hypothetical protein
MITRIQCVFRGYLARKAVKILKKDRYHPAMPNIKSGNMKADATYNYENENVKV